VRREWASAAGQVFQGLQGPDRVDTSPVESRLPHPVKGRVLEHASTQGEDELLVVNVALSHVG
jgi:hypothetical protein